MNFYKGQKVSLQSTSDSKLKVTVGLENQQEYAAVIIKKDGTLEKPSNKVIKEALNIIR